jgi:hypothetical protein
MKNSALQQAIKLSAFLAANHLTPKQAAEMPLAELKKLKGFADVGVKGIKQLSNFKEVKK